MFDSKHLKRGELAVVRAASSKAAAGHAAELRQTNHEAAALAQQKRQDIDGECSLIIRHCCIVTAELMTAFRFDWWCSA